MSYGVHMPPHKTPIRWTDVLERKSESPLPFLRFYRDAGLIPRQEQASPPPFVRRRPAL